MHDRPLPVDERLIMPESGYEVIDGWVVEVAPSDELHGTRHSKLSALLEAHAADEYDVASDMLTRTSATNDLAPDASVFPSARHPETGGRQLEELAFEVVSTESLSHAGTKAARLSERGVRRVFALDVERKRALEWSRATDAWEILAPDAVIEDRCLAAPLAVRALAESARADDAVARALLHKGNAVLREAIDAAAADAHAAGRSEGKSEGKTEGKAESVLAVLAARDITVDEHVRQRIRATRDERVLDRWLAEAVRCRDVAELLG